MTIPNSDGDIEYGVGYVVSKSDVSEEDYDNIEYEMTFCTECYEDIRQGIRQRMKLDKDERHDWNLFFCSVCKNHPSIGCAECTGIVGVKGPKSLPTGFEMKLSGSSNANEPSPRKDT